MQRESGLQSWLKLPFLYNLLQDATGGNALRRRVLEKHVRASARDKVIDIGCGPARMLAWLPNVEYIGLDTNPDYIASARRTYGSKGTFIVGDTKSLQDDVRFKDADIVIALGVLHHLDDEDAAHCVRFAYDALKEKGRFVCLDACWTPNQSWFSKFVMSHDRGQNVRTEQRYRQLAGKAFTNVDTWVDEKPLRIPYVTVVLECKK
jgi:SAM-dependent methyltransferase